MKTRASRHEDDKDKKKRLSKKEDANNGSYVRRVVASLSQKQIQRMLDTNRSIISKKNIDPTGRAIFNKIQMKMEISQPQDQAEVQADKVAEGVMKGDVNSSKTALSQKASSEISAKGEGGTMQTTDGFDQQLAGTKGQGQKLNPDSKSELEEHTGTDLSGVNVHTNSKASEMSESINAKAFTHGQDIYFKQGNYNPTSNEGKSLLAHEVTHTVQQQGAVQRKIQRQIDLEMAQAAFKKMMSADPATLLINSLFSGWNSLSPEEKEKRMNASFDKKIAALKLMDGQEPPGPIKTFSLVMEGAGGALMPFPSIESMWPIMVNGQLGYYQYLRNLSNKYIKPEEVVTSSKDAKAPLKAPEAKDPKAPEGMVVNPNYKKGGYGAVLDNSVKNLTDPSFMLGELEGIFVGIGHWFRDIGLMIADLFELIMGSFADTWKKLNDVYTISTTGKLPADLQKQFATAQAASNWLSKNRGLVSQFIIKLVTDEKMRKELGGDLKKIATGAVKQLARGAGGMVARAESEFMGGSAFEQGESLGKIVGYIIPEILLAVFSDAIGNALKAGLQAFRASRVALETLNALKWLVELGTDVFNALGRFGKKLGSIADGAFKGIGKAFEEILIFFKRLMGLEKELPDVEKLLSKTDKINDVKALGKTNEATKLEEQQAIDNWLKYHEKEQGISGKQKHGHTKTNHTPTLSQTAEDKAIERFQRDLANKGRNKLPPSSSAFNNTAHAQEELSAAINGERTAIKNWLNDPTGPVKVDFRVKAITRGKSISKADFLHALDNGLDYSTYFREVENVTVVLRKNPKGKGYYILTSYPDHLPIKPLTY